MNVRTKILNSNLNFTGSWWKSFNNRVLCEDFWAFDWLICFLQGENVPRELQALVKDLPAVLDEVGKDAARLEEQIQLYAAFTNFVCDWWVRDTVEMPCYGEKKHNFCYFGQYWNLKYLKLVSYKLNKRLKTFHGESPWTLNVVQTENKLIIEL